MKDNLIVDAKASLKIYFKHLPQILGIAVLISVALSLALFSYYAVVLVVFLYVFSPLFLLKISTQSKFDKSHRIKIIKTVIVALLLVQIPFGFIKSFIENSSDSIVGKLLEMFFTNLSFLMSLTILFLYLVENRKLQISKIFKDLYVKVWENKARFLITLFLVIFVPVVFREIASIAFLIASPKAMVNSPTYGLYIMDSLNLSVGEFFAIMYTISYAMEYLINALFYIFLLRSYNR